MDNPFRIQQQAEAVRRMVRDTARNRMGLPPVWTDSTTPRTERPVRFRRVAIRKRNAWGTGWDHYSKSETFRYGY